MKYTVYSKDNCPQCVKAKSMIDSAGGTYEEVNVPRDIDAIDFMEKFNGVRSMPYIIAPNGNEFNINQLEISLRLNILGEL